MWLKRVFTLSFLSKTQDACSAWSKPLEYELVHREAWIEREANSFREWNWFHAPGKTFWHCCRLILFQYSTGITTKPSLAHEKASIAFFKALEPCGVASYKIVSCIMKIDSADKFLDHDQFKASLLCASLQTRPWHWNNVHVKNS